MDFSLTDEPDAILCPRNVRDGKVSDRYLAPAISRFAESFQATVGMRAEIDQQTKDVWQDLMSLHQRWVKVNKHTGGENIQAQACTEAARALNRDISVSRTSWHKGVIVGRNGVFGVFRL